MIFDLQSMFSDRQAITATAASTNAIDFGAPGTPQHAAAPITQDVGRGGEVPLRVQVTEDFAGLTSLTIELQVDNDAAFGSPKTVSTLTVPVANLVAGYVAAPQYLPFGTDERYARILYTVTGANATAGQITAGLVAGHDAWSA